MANPKWPFWSAQNPVGTPSPFAESDPAYKSYDNWIRTQPEVGMAKIRRRFTGKTENLTFSLVLTQAQRDTLDSFVSTTIKEVLPFDWVDLRKPTTAMTYKLNKTPDYQFIGWNDDGSSWWKVSVSLDTVP